MDKILMKAIIEENVNLADESLANFVATCFKSVDNFSDKHELTELLYKVLSTSFGGFKDIAGIIVNDEGYFKWGSLDKFNQGCARGDDILGLLSYMYAVLVSNHEEVKKEIIDIDFTLCPDIYERHGAPHNSLPPCISTSWMTGGYTIDGLKHSAGTHDLYVGMVVPMDMFPEAKRAPIYEGHNAILVDDHKTWNEVNPRKIWTMMYKSNVGHRMEYGDSNTGLVYVPVEKTFDKLRDTNMNDTGFEYTTLLPRHILEKYNLPIGEI